MKRRLGLVVLLVAAACTEETTSPGVCPDFCPGGSIEIHDTIFTAIIERDSSFRGYLQNYQAEAMTATDIPGVIDSRAFFTTDTVQSRVAPKAGDTATVAKVMDSVRVRFVIVRRPKNTTNLRLRLYRLPVGVDSTSDFASLDPYFTATPVDSLNVNDLLALPAIGDTQTIRLWSDSIRVDTAGHVLQINRIDSTVAVYFNLDTLQAPFDSADSGRVAWGVRVAADSFASVTLGTTESGTNPPLVRWFYHYTIPDTVSATPDSVVNNDKTVPNRFDSFVFDPPTPPLDSNLAVGGVPAARSLLRVLMPAYLHDSVDVVRATLILVPVNAVPGAPSDSFRILARPVSADLGAKSPLSPDATLFGRTYIHIGSPDTVRLELTSLVRAWSLDTTRTTAFILGQVPEAASYTEARFYSSRAPASRPALHVTYVKRFRFGEP
ncbi:MAG TPA: hypothetical protein VGQ29_05175 [Gemmatimonadales bacterium]|nr:hypothetical protein [Gemmatimonadales bacterium]